MKWADLSWLPPVLPPCSRGTDCVQPGAVIHDQDGNFIYSAYAVAGQTMQFTKTAYQGADVLLVWTGEFRAAGYGFGRNLLLSTSYDVVANLYVPFSTEGLVSHFLSESCSLSESGTGT